ncbi:MAG: hypothetical protein ACRD59_06375 [Candidatus Acidiferrales bacterium]
MSPSSLSETAVQSAGKRFKGTAGIGAFLLIVAAATAVVMPMFFLGNASGHDFGFHLASWLDVAGQWREGIAYPRWTEWANGGFGEPRFIFYPPASWALGAALGSVLSWRMVPGAFIWLTLILSGVTMWRLAREWLPNPQAAAAAVIFAANPYQLVVVYYRSDFAELLASAIFPLLILGAGRVVRDGSREISGDGWRESWDGLPLLAIAFAGIWLSNAPAAVIATYSLALLLAVGCILQRSFRPLLSGGAAMVFGFGLAAFYILPAAFEQRWVQIGQVVGENLRPAQNFLFTGSSDPEFVLFNWKVSGVALGMILLTGVAAVFSARYRRDARAPWWMMLALASASVFLMFPASIWAWRYLPKLQFVQFPWRWLVPLSVPYALFVASAVGRSRRRRIWYCALAVVIASTAIAMIRNAWWDSEDVPTLLAAIQSDRGYDGTDEYAPIGCDRYNLPGVGQDAEPSQDSQNIPGTPRIAQLDPESDEIVPAAGDRIQIDKWTAETRVFRVEEPEPATLALRLINYPAWMARIDGNPVEIRGRPETDQVLIDTLAGSHTVELSFRRTPDRIAGTAISGVSSVILLGFVILVGRRRHESSQH